MRKRAHLLVASCDEVECEAYERTYCALPQGRLRLARTYYATETTGSAAASSRRCRAVPSAVRSLRKDRLVGGSSGDRPPELMINHNRMPQSACNREACRKADAAIDHQAPIVHVQPLPAGTASSNGKL